MPKILNLKNKGFNSWYQRSPSMATSPCSFGPTERQILVWGTALLMMVGSRERKRGEITSQHPCMGHVPSGLASLHYTLPPNLHCFPTVSRVVTRYVAQVFGGSSQIQTISPSVMDLMSNTKSSLYITPFDIWDSLTMQFRALKLRILLP